VGDHDADGAAPLALDADALVREVRRAALEERAQGLEELDLADRASPELEVDGDVVGDPRGRREARDVFGPRVDDAAVLLHVGEVLQRLDPSRRRARANRHESLRLRPDLLDPLRVVRRRHRPLDQGEVVGALEDRARSLSEVADVDRARDREELVLAVEDRELAAVARGELEDAQTGLAGLRHRP